MMLPDVSEGSGPGKMQDPVTPTALDALRSPTTTFVPLQSRESVTESEFNDVSLDDEATFSSIALTSQRNSVDSHFSKPESIDNRPRSHSFAEIMSLGSPTGPRHKKTASTTTIRSSRGLPFFFNGSDPQDTTVNSNRGSIEGQQKLQEEFARRQREIEVAAVDISTDNIIDWDFWGAVISDYQGYASEHPEELAQAIAKGIPATLRGMMWQHMAASKDPDLESTYLKLLKGTSIHEKAITRDLGRTFPHHDFFTDGSGIGQENLFNVLKAYSLYDPQVGYCQGLPFVVAILLLNMPDEEAFSLLVRLMYAYDLRGHFLPEMPKLQMRLFDRLIEELLPVLHVHFLRQGIKSSMFCSQWFLTMFSYRFPLESVFRIYDNCLANGIEAIFGFSVILLKKNEGTLLSLKFDEILAFLNTKLFDAYKIPGGGEKEDEYNIDQFVQDSVSLQITPFMLDAYRHEYEDMVRENNKHAIEMDGLRNSNRSLSAQVKNLETSLAQLNADHVQVLNELVKQRLRNEEMEEELVRYKLLYAEAMHKNEDARSSHRLSAAARRGSKTSVRHQTRVEGFRRPRQAWLVYTTSAIVLATAGAIAFETSQPFRHTTHAVVRCSRVAGAAVLGAIDYKWTFARNYLSEEVRQQAYSECHTRSAQRVLRALLANGGVFIKMGQHMASLYMLPKEWTSTMRPLQDRCEPTPYKNIEQLLLQDMGVSIPEMFEEFDPEPIGVASLAQVHVGRLKDTQNKVAVKLQHPHLAEFCDIDTEMVEVTLGWIKYWFPEFEFTWLAEELRTNLPKEMDFVHEADNATRVTHDFADTRTSLYIPEVIVARKRVLIMEYIQGGRVDDLAYLASANIDRNKVALELSRIFSQMVFVNGWFHADPHPGNLLIRPTPPNSTSPYNFEVVLLDHGLYFDIDTTLRVNYSKFWLSLIASASPSTLADRRKYAELVGNITPDLYPVFESAITGRAGLEGTWDDNNGTTFKRASGMIDITPQTVEEMDTIRDAVVNREGLLLSVFDILRRVPRRVLMVLKLNDLTRSLDYALATTHSNIRVFLITAKYCAFAVWQAERSQIFDGLRDKGLFSFCLLKEYFTSWWRYERIYTRMIILETILDFQGLLVKTAAWCRGLQSQGFIGARRAASGLRY
ncbi:hypothetical protein AX17_005603 [Amanita inopinata Kibby_2008]|nr:hypothetical protein AX17_005603 [Amanita inopinata Kibby_2008]